MTVSANALARDIEALIHPYTNLAAFRETGPLIITSGKGIYVYDLQGKPYIEGMAGLWCTSLGYGNEELIEAGREQLSKLAFGHLFGGKSHDPAIELAERLKEISPAPASKIFFTASGSEANDTQIKLAWYYNNARGKPRKKKIISRKRAYHGVTLAAASLTGLPNIHLDFDLPFSWTRHLTCPHFYREALPAETEEGFSTRLANELDAMIQHEGPDTVAAFIAEPVMGAGGVVVPPKGYFDKIQAVLSRYDILFIVDEVICGFGRTGRMFGSQTYGLRAGYHHHCQGPHLGLCAARRDDGAGGHVSGHAGRKPQDRHVRAWLHLWRTSAVLRDRRSRRSKFMRATTLPAMSVGHADLPDAAAGAQRASARWRDARRRADRRRRACRRQGNTKEFQSAPGHRRQGRESSARMRG